jgi:hypothetical protein
MNVLTIALAIAIPLWDGGTNRTNQYQERPIEYHDSNPLIEKQDPALTGTGLLP